MSRRSRSFALAALAPLLIPAALSAQNAQAPVHYLTFTRFTAPIGTEDRGKVMMFLDSMMIAPARLDPNLVSFYVGTHNWGSNGSEIVLVREYTSWAAIEGDCAPCDAYTAAHTPKEGTPEYQKWQGISEAFYKYFGGHSDEIYAVPASRRSRAP
jgi:hypothetical protein